MSVFTMGFLCSFLTYIILAAIFLAINWYGKGVIGKFLDSISPFPYLREGGNYKNYSERTYEGRVLDLFVSTLITYICAMLSFMSYIALLIILQGYLFPAFLILLRIRTFSDDNVLPESGRSYNPGASYVYSMMGFILLIVDLAIIYLVNLPLYIIIPVLIFGSLSSLVPIFPDYINRFLPYDIRSEEGDEFLKKITGILAWINMSILIFYFVFIVGAPLSEVLPPRLGGR